MFMITLMLFIIAACDPAVEEPTPAEILTDAKGNIAIAFSGSDTASNVTANFTLPTSVNSELGTISIAWSSSNTAVITISGSTATVTRPAVNTQVTVTATLTLEGANDSRPFQVTVLAEEVDPEDVFDAIDLEGEGVEWNEDQGRYVATGNITLPTSLMGVTISWSSANEDVISTTGAVTRPAWGTSNSLVVLTATIGDAERSFPVNVLAETVKPVSAKLAEAAAVLLIPNTTNGVINDLDLPDTAGTEGVTVTWQSSNTEVLGHDGKITYPDVQTNVTMTATLTLESQSITKVFNLVVLTSVDPVFETESIAALLEWGATNATTSSVTSPYVKLIGMTVMARTKDTFWITDGENVMGVYTESTPNEKFAVGEVFDLYGAFEFYFGAPQLRARSGGRPLKSDDSEAAVSVMAPTPVTDVEAFITALKANEEAGNNPYSQTNPMEHNYITLTAKVRVQGPGNYDVVLVNPSYAGANIDTSIGSLPASGVALMVYYQSNIEAIRLFNGLEVTLNVIVNARRTNNSIYAVVFAGTADDITPVATDTQLADIVAAALGNQLPADIQQATTLSLPTSLLGTTISWASDNALINATTGEVTMPESGQVSVKLTATITKGDVNKVQNYNIRVGILPLLDIADARAQVSGNVKVQGTVVAMAGPRTFVLQDESGSVILYIGSGAFEAIPSSPTDATVSGINAWWAKYGGKVILVEGERTSNNGLQQIKPYAVTIQNVPAANFPVANIDEVALTPEALLPYQSQLVKRTNLEIIEIPAQSYGNILFKLQDPVTEELIDLFWDSRTLLVGDQTVQSITAHLSTFAVGNFIDVDGAAIGWNNGPRFELTSPENVYLYVEEPATDADKVAYVGAHLGVPTQTSSNIILPVEASWGVTISWASSNPDVLSATGVAVVPTGLAVDVTLTATVTSGEVSDTFDVVVTVGTPITPISDVHALPAGAFVRVQGIVIAKSKSAQYGNAQVYIQDATGGIQAFRAAGADADLIEVGDLVVWEGNTAAYSGLSQFAQPGASVINRLVQVISEGNDLPTAVSITDDTSKTAARLKLTTVTGYLKDAITTAEQSAYYNLVLANGYTLSFRVISLGDTNQDAIDSITAKLNGLAAGTELTITTVTANSSNPYLLVFNGDAITVGAVADAATLGAIAVSSVTFPAANAEVTANFALPASGPFGLTITWTSQNSAIAINEAGNGAVVTRGETDATGTLTWVAMMGETQIDTDVVAFTVLAEEGGEPEPTEFATDLFISEYIEAAPGNRKAIEIANFTGASVDLTQYSVRLATNGAATFGAAITLTGTLAHGDVFVVYNDDSATNDRLAPFGDLETTALAFNGDDAIALFKGETAIDVFGVLGVDPGSSWAVGADDTVDVIIIRNANVASPTTTWNVSEWSVVKNYVSGDDAVGYVTTLGSHTFTPAA